MDGVAYTDFLISAPGQFATNAETTAEKLTQLEEE